MTTTAHTVETATVLLASRVGSPPLNDADQREINRISGLFESATTEQDEALDAHLKGFRTDAQARAYERVALKLASWAVTASIMGQADKAAEYEEMAAVQREMADAVRLLG